MSANEAKTDESDQARLLRLGIERMSAGTGSWLCSFDEIAQLVHSRSDAKLVLFMRHARSKMNEIKSNPGFVDPMTWDAELSEAGMASARAISWLGPALEHFGLRPQLVVCSPFRRTIRTAELVLRPLLDAGHCSLVVQPLAREAISDSGDCGRPADELRCEFPHVDFSHMPDGHVWWWYPECTERTLSSEAAYALFRELEYEEPHETVAERAAALRTWLAERTERCIFVVSHGDMIRATLGNSEGRITNLSLTTTLIDAAGTLTILRMDTAI